jgi:DNA-binding beta-propeller fold protein YncE
MRRHASLGLAALAALAFAGSASASEAVYVASDSSGAISQFTIGQGGELAADAPASVPAGDGPQGIVASPNGLYLYTANGQTDGAGGVSQFTVGTGGGLSPDATPSVNGGNGPWAIAESPDGQHLYTANINDGCPIGLAATS